MDEPKRRARRAQQAPLEAHMPEQEAPKRQESGDPPAHRRRPQQATLPAMEAQASSPKRAAWLAKMRGGAARMARAIGQAALGALASLNLAARAMRSAAKRIGREQLRLAAMALCICVAAVSAWQVGGIVLRSMRTRRLNDSLSQQRAAIIEAQQTQTPLAEATPMIGTTPQMEEISAAQQLTAAQKEPGEWTPLASAAPDCVKTTRYRRVGGEALPEMAQLHAQNRDLVAWIQIPDVLDLPVVYRDNDYYLTHDFSKEKNASGAIFLDENHPFREKTQNLLLHGHNMKDGTMFGRLAQYLHDDSYLRNHPFIYFDTLWHKEQYVIFAVLNVSLDPGDARFFNYFTHDTFSSDAQFETYVRQLQLRSEYAIPIDVAPSDALLTLSTCLDDDRLVIVCRRLREDETRSDLRALIRMAAKQ